MNRRHWLVCAVALAGALMLPATAARAQIGWTDRVDSFLGTSSSVSAPLISVDASGNAMAVWSQLASTGQEVVRAARFDKAGGAWAASVDLSSAGNPQSAGFPALALNEAGDAVVVWLQGPSVVRAARYAAATGTWSSAVDLSPSGTGPFVALAANGDAVALWSGSDTVITAARYSVALGTWTAGTDISGPDAHSARVAIGPAGDAVALWVRSSGQDAIVQTARAPAGGVVWGSAVDLSATGQSASGPQLTIAASGAVLAIWTRGSGSAITVQAARDATGTGTWSQAVDVSASGAASDPQIAVDPAGNAVAVWRLNTWIQSASYTTAADAWSGAIDLANVGNVVSRPQVGLDHAGNASAVWYVGATPELPYTLQTGRRTAAGVWSTTVLPVNRALDARVAVDPVGNAIVVWRRLNLSLTLSVLSTRWQATPVAPGITEAVPGNGTLTIGVTAPPAEAGFANTNYEYSIDDGATWTARSPASAASPLVITGLANGITRTVRLRGVNIAGAGAASAPVSRTPAVAPRAPTGLVAASIVGNMVTLRWAPAADSLPPSGYVVEGGVFSGQVLASVPTRSTAPTFTFPAPSGAFYVRLHALAGAARSGPSNEIRIGVNVAAPPSAPAGLLGMADGAALTLVWQPTFEGGAATGFVLDVSGTLSGSIALPPSDRFTYPAVPPGTYDLAVRALNPFGSSAPSSVVTLTFPGTCAPPAAPTSFSAAVSGRTIFASWSPPDAGAAATGYVLVVTGALAGNFATAGLSLSGAVGPGSYTLSAVATNACGSSPWTAPQTVIVH